MADVNPGRPPALLWSRLTGWGAAAFPVVLWLFATFFFLGRLGKWLDDYWLGLRDPVTGAYELPLWPWDTWPFFYRPLHLFFVHYAQTLLWHHDWANHLINVLSHGLVVFLLWRFLRAHTRTGQAATVAAIAFLVYPLGYEVIFWPAAVNASIATATFLLLAMMYVGYVRAGGGPALLWLMAMVAFSIPCWNEQPATGIAALGLLGWAVAPRRESVEERVRRCLAPVILGGLACVIYIVLVQATAPAGARGSEGSLAPWSHLPARIADVYREVTHKKMFGEWTRHIVLGGLSQGWAVLARPPSWLWLALLVPTTLLWLRRWMGREVIVRDDRDSLTRPAGVFAFGLGLFLIAWLPVALLKAQIVEPRICYFPALGLAVAGAMVIDQLGVWLAPYRASCALFKGVVGVALLAWALPSALAMVGVQDALRKRYRLDRREMDQLKAMVPDPPAGTVFVPLHIEDMGLAASTGYSNFDKFAVGALGTPWSAKSIIDWTYGRDDLYCTARSWWQPLALRALNARTAWYPLMPGPRRSSHPAGGPRISWSRMVPFVVDAKGQVHLVSLIRVTRPDHQGLLIPISYVQGLLRERGLPDHEFTIADKAGTADLPPRDVWRWATTGQPVQLTTVCAWGSDRVCVAMHPRYPDQQDMALMSTILPPADRAYRLHFRATFAEHDPNQGKGDGVELLWYLDEQRSAPLASLSLPPGRLAADQRWFPVSFTMPAHAQPRTLSVEVLPGPAGDWSYDMVRVTCGDREE